MEGIGGTSGSACRETLHDLRGVVDEEGSFPPGEWVDPQGPRRLEGWVSRVRVLRLP